MPALAIGRCHHIRLGPAPSAVSGSSSRSCLLCCCLPSCAQCSSRPPLHTIVHTIGTSGVPLCPGLGTGALVMRARLGGSRGCVLGRAWESGETRSRPGAFDERLNTALKGCYRRLSAIEDRLLRRKARRGRTTYSEHLKGRVRRHAGLHFGRKHPHGVCSVHDPTPLGSRNA